MGSPLGFGITAASRPGHSRLGAELERLGYAELWVNDTSRGDGLATLGEVAGGAARLRFGIGVVALSEQAPATIAARASVPGVPGDRLTLGVGSGSAASLDLVRQGVAELRGLLPGMPIAVTAVGPRMAGLAGELADAVVANWALPDRLTFVRDHVREGAERMGRPPPRLVAYVRTAIGPGAANRLEAEMARYRRFGPHYARAFDAQPDEPIGVAVESGDPAELASALAAYRATADMVVLRGLPAGDAVDAWLEIARAGAPLNRAS